jgi:hypothetical protein
LLTEPSVRKAFGFAADADADAGYAIAEHGRDEQPSELLTRTVRMSSALRGIAEELALAKREVADLRRENATLRRRLDDGGARAISRS